MERAEDFLSMAQYGVTNHNLLETRLASGKTTLVGYCSIASLENCHGWPSDSKDVDKGQWMTQPSDAISTVVYIQCSRWMPLESLPQSF